MADLFNKAIINNGEFQGHVIGGVTKKISAYADDTAVHVGSVWDIEIMEDMLDVYNLATGGAMNVDKSQAVGSGNWRADKSPPMALARYNP